jgi:hypothetical protein
MILGGRLVAAVMLVYFVYDNSAFGKALLRSYTRLDGLDIEISNTECLPR